MPYDVPYTEETYTPEDALVPGNSTSDRPVEFDIAPAGGADLARLKSIIYATAGLTSNGMWTDALQTSVEDAFRHGARVFEGTVLAVRNFTVPAGMAHRAGIWGQKDPPADRKEPFPITTGRQFAAVAGFVSSIALSVAFHITALSGKVEGMDSRFFAQPSGSGSRGISPKTAGTATDARRDKGARGTAGKRTGKRANRQATT